jgi:hypothetical protein
MSDFRERTWHKGIRSCTCPWQRNNEHVLKEVCALEIRPYRIQHLILSSDISMPHSLLIYLKETLVVLPYMSPFVSIRILTGIIRQYYTSVVNHGLSSVRQVDVFLLPMIFAGIWTFLRMIICRCRTFYISFYIFCFLYFSLSTFCGFILYMFQCFFLFSYMPFLVFTPHVYFLCY